MVTLSDSDIIDNTLIGLVGILIALFIWSFPSQILGTIGILIIAYVIGCILRKIVDAI